MSFDTKVRIIAAVVGTAALLVIAWSIVPWIREARWERRRAERMRHTEAMWDYYAARGELTDLDIDWADE